MSALLAQALIDRPEEEDLLAWRESLPKEMRAREDDLFRIIVVLAATGARFSQVIRIRVQDVQIASDRLMVPKSRKGKFAKPGHIAIPVGRDVMGQLAGPLLTLRRSHTDSSRPKKLLI